MSVMKWNALCARCVHECKQHKSVTVVSCPAFASAEKNLDLFDVKGNIRVRSVSGPAKRRGKKRSAAPDMPGNPGSNKN